MRVYTLAEARALLPVVQPVLAGIASLVQELRAMQAAMSVDMRGASGDGALTANPWAEHSKDRGDELTRLLQEAVARLEQWGIELKDPDRGLIDFHHEREGEVVYLCYMLGEPDIDWWHPLETGYAGRRPV
ncbi:MAG: DUF2203 domain-containing protein [Dehalococcoidia bacterium]